MNIILGVITGGLILKIKHMRYDIVYFGELARIRETTGYLGGGALFGLLFPEWYIQVIALAVTALIAVKISRG